MRVTGRVILCERERKRDCGSGFRLKRRTEEEEEEEGMEWQKEALNPTNFTIYVMADVNVEFGGASQGICFSDPRGLDTVFRGFCESGF